jgi:hypothetical protein
MILLHVAVAALYVLTAWALWPAPVSTAPAGPRLPAISATLLLPAALVLHAWLAWKGIATPEGLLE